jgi:5-methylthioadenosine/S-adenosylhomocysteine deaminase
MDTLITNATIVTGDTTQPIIENGAVLVRDDRIAGLGDSPTLEAAHPEAKRHDGRGKAVLPGLINSHTHTVLTILRATVEDMEGNAVYGYMVPITLSMTAEERRAMVNLGALEAIRSGTTTLVESNRHVPDYASYLVPTGLRLVFSELCTDALINQVRRGQHTYDQDRGKEYLDRANQLIDELHGAADGRVEVQVASHATDNCSPWMLEQLLTLARKHGLRRNIHLAQSPLELEQVKRLCGGTPAEYLKQNDWLDDTLIGAHWTWCTESDIDLLAEHGVHMAHCPANSSRRGPHRANVARIRDQGVNIVLGTDNMTEDMFQALKIGLIVHRGGYEGGSIEPQPEEMLAAATRNGARALGREDDLGSIATGKKADLTILKLGANLRPVINLISAIVHYGHPGNVDGVMVNGEFLMQDGTVLAMDEDQVIEDAEKAARAVWSRLMIQSPDIEPPRGATWLQRQA